jgi:hypothetical protein
MFCITLCKPPVTGELSVGGKLKEGLRLKPKSSRYDGLVSGPLSSHNDGLGSWPIPSHYNGLLSRSYLAIITV